MIQRSPLTPPIDDVKAPHCLSHRIPFEGSEVADRHLGQRIALALQAAGYVPLRKVDVIARDGCIILKGTVPTYYLKQLAQSAAMSVSRVHAIDNRLDVLSLS